MAMKSHVFTTLILTCTLVVLASCNTCKPKFIRRYNKCLNEGFPSALGCVSDQGKLSGRALSRPFMRCQKLETTVKDCGYSCYGSEEAKEETPVNYKAACPLHVGIHETWNGGVAFMHDDEELLYVGLHPEQRKFAVRNSVYPHGYLDQGYRWESVYFPPADSTGRRHFSFSFGRKYFQLRCQGMLQWETPYKILTSLERKASFRRKINNVKFYLSAKAADDSVTMTYRIDC